MCGDAADTVGVGGAVVVCGPPYVANDHIQFHLMGEMKYDDGQADTCNQDPEYATYMAQEDKSFSQMVVTEAAAKDFLFTKVEGDYIIEI